MHQHQHQLRGIYDKGRVHFECTTPECGWSSTSRPGTQIGVALARLDANVKSLDDQARGDG